MFLSLNIISCIVLLLKNSAHLIWLFCLRSNKIPCPIIRVFCPFRLLQEVPLIDGHNDLPWNIRKFLHNKLKNFKFNEDLRNVSPWSSSAWSHTDLVRLEQGHVAAQVSVFPLCSFFNNLIRLLRLLYFDYMSTYCKFCIF